MSKPKRRRTGLPPAPSCANVPASHAGTIGNRKAGLAAAAMSPDGTKRTRQSCSARSVHRGKADKAHLGRHVGFDPDHSATLLARAPHHLRVMRPVEIAFEAQMLHAAAMTPHKLEGLYPDLDMRFDVVRGYCAIRRFGLHALGDHWLIGHEEQRAGWNVIGKSRCKDRRSLHVDRHAPCATQLLLKAIIVFPDRRLVNGFLSRRR